MLPMDESFLLKVLNTYKKVKKESPQEKYM